MVTPAPISESSRCAVTTVTRWMRSPMSSAVFGYNAARDEESKRGFPARAAGPLPRARLAPDGRGPGARRPALARLVVRRRGRPRARRDRRAGPRRARMRDASAVLAAWLGPATWLAVPTLLLAQGAGGLWPGVLMVVAPLLALTLRADPPPDEAPRVSIPLVHVATYFLMVAVLIWAGLVLGGGLRARGA